MGKLIRIRSFPLGIVLLLICTMAESSNASSVNIAFTNGDINGIKRALEIVFHESPFVLEWSDKPLIYNIFYDTKDMVAFESGKALVYSKEEYLTKIKRKVKYKESILLDKFSGVISYPVKHYGEVKSMEEKNAFISMIKRRERDVFFETLHANAIDVPMSIHPVFNVARQGILVTLSLKGRPAASLSIEETLVLFRNSEYSFSSIETIKHTNTETEKALLGSLFSSVAKQSADQGYHLIEYESATRYGAYFNYLKTTVPYFEIRVRYPVADKLYAAFILVLIGSIVISICFFIRKRYLAPEKDISDFEHYK